MRFTVTMALAGALLLGAACGAVADDILGRGLPLRIGADSEGGSRFAGEIACARLYSRALSAKEVRSLAGRRPGAPGPTRGLIGEWLPGQGVGARAPRGAVVGNVAATTEDGVRCGRMGDGFVQVAADPRLDARSLTAEAWIRPRAAAGPGGRIFDRITAGGSDGWLLDVYPAMSLRVIVGGAQVYADNVLAAGAWAHVAAVIEPSGVRVFLNGKQLGAPAALDDAALTGRAPAPTGDLTLWYRAPAASWTQALVLGNGRMGAMLHGGVRHEQIDLNDDTLWSGEPADTMPPEAARYVPEVRRLLIAGRNREAHNLTAAKLLGPFFQSYLPMGALHIGFGQVKAASDYRRELDLHTGIARVEYRAGGVTYRREVFVSHPAQAAVVRLTADRPGKLAFTVRLDSQLRGAARVEGDTVVFSGRAPAFLDAYGGKPILYEDGPDGRGMRFEMRLRVDADGGRVTVAGDGLRVEGAGSATLRLAEATSYAGFRWSPSRYGRDPSAICRAQLAAISDVPYETLRSEHAADVRVLMDRVAIRIGKARRDLPTDDRVRAYDAKRDADLAALYYQFGRYLLVSGSRPGSQPLNLQGIWNDRLVAPWASNWTLNCNAEINYWPAEAANLAECHLPIVQLAQDLSVDGARVARVMYGAGGWMAHHNADLWRRATPVSGDPVWAIFQTGGAWLCQHAWEHYAFTGDAEYLRGVWPTLRGAAEYFLDSMLREPTHGWLVTAPATNFESYFRKPGGETAAVCMGPTADMQMVRQLFENCLKAGRLLRLDDAFLVRVRKALPDLAPMQVSTRTGQIQEWLEDWDAESPGNGQILSLWGLVCSNQIDRRRTPDLARAIRKSLDDRKPWDLWVGSWTGAFATNAFARLGDGDQALMVLNRHLARAVNPNLTARFEGMADWEIDGNMGQCAAVGEMLLQSQADEVNLLPALPTAWSDGAVSGLRARGGFEVSLTWRHGRLVSGGIVSHLGGACRVRLGESVTSLPTEPGEAYAIDASGHVARLAKGAQ